MGYKDSDAQLGVEQFMHDYYSHVLSLREVNDILLQHFDEAILRAHYEPEIEPINERFQFGENGEPIVGSSCLRNRKTSSRVDAAAETPFAVSIL